MSHSDPDRHETSPPAAPPADPYRGDEVQSGLVAIVGVFAAVVLLLIIVLVQAWYFTWKGEVTAERASPADAPGTPLGKMIEEHQQQLNSYHWVDREKHLRAIPIDRAMEIVADEFGRGAKGGGDDKKKTEVKNDGA